MNKQATLSLVMALCMGVAFAVRAGDGRWEDDFAKAKAEAAEKGRPILMDFTGSDWCPWCVRLDKEVFSKNDFKKYARENLVLFIADFPRGTKLPKKEAAQNKELAEKYGVRGFPTVLLVDATGKEIARTGYQEGGAEEYVKHLQELLKDFKAPEAAGDNAAKDK